MRIKGLTRIFSGLRAIYTPAMRRCVQQAGRLIRNTLLPTFSSRYSAMWVPRRPESRPRHPELWPHCSEPRPRCHQTGGFAPLGCDTPATRRREVPNGAKPPPLPLVSGSLTDAMPFTGAGLPGGVPKNVGGASPRMMGASRSPAPRVCLLLMRCIPSEELVRARLPNDAALDGAWDRAATDTFPAIRCCAAYLPVGLGSMLCRGVAHTLEILGN